MAVVFLNLAIFLAQLILLIGFVVDALRSEGLAVVFHTLELDADKTQLFVILIELFAFFLLLEDCNK